MHTLKVAMWLSCLGINLLGLLVVLRTGAASAVLYAAFVSATLALNRPRLNFSAFRETMQTSRPVLLFQWLRSRLMGISVTSKAR